MSTIAMKMPGPCSSQEAKATPLAAASATAAKASLTAVDTDRERGFCMARI